MSVRVCPADLSNCSHGTVIRAHPLTAPPPYKHTFTVMAAITRRTIVMSYRIVICLHFESTVKYKIVFSPHDKRQNAPMLKIIIIFFSYFSRDPGDTIA